MDLLFGLFPLTYVFLFQFASSPSPDLPVYLFAFILFSMFLKNEVTNDSFLIITIFALFTVFIKITAFVLLLFPLILVVKHFAVVKKQLFSAVSLGVLVLLLLVLKNTMLTGYPLFPLLYFRMDDLDYTVPALIMNFFFSKSVMHSFYIDNAAFSDASLLDLAKHYFLLNGMSGYIGILSLLTLLVTPIIILKKQLPKALWTIYFVFFCIGSGFMLKLTAVSFLCLFHVVLYFDGTVVMDQQPKMDTSILWIELGASWSFSLCSLVLRKLN